MLEILGFVGLLIAVVYWYVRNVYFFRDPPRVPPKEAGIIVAPCDGTVIYVKPFKEGRVESVKMGETISLSEIHKSSHRFDAGWLIGIYMSPLDVHFNYAPVSGTVTDVVHIPAAKNLPMVDMWEYINLTFLRRAVDLFSHRFRLINERNTIFLRPDAGPFVAMVEIADKFVNKIKCFVRPGETVKVGQKVSFICRGSQVDLIIADPSARIAVKTGSRVKGGETIIARFDILPKPNGLTFPQEN